MLRCETKAPSACSAHELKAFEALAVSAGKVAAAGLSELIQKARLLAFVYDSGRLIGVAGLKRPRESYRRRVSARSGIQLPAQAYPYELGWVSVLRGEEGGKSKLLCEALLSQAPEAGVFATTGLGNVKMRARLQKMGFLEQGERWQSSQVEEILCLLTLAR